jgi:hypothetical protein
MSINRQAADVTEHNAAFIVFDQLKTGGVIGTATAEQISNGYSLPNIQQAIDDMWAIALVIPGSVYQSLSATDPSVSPTVTQSQTVQLTVTGTPTANGTITVANINVSVLTTDTATTVATKIAAAMTAQTFISSASALSGVVTYSYVDSGTHPVDNKVQNGITMSSKTTTLGGKPGYLGYGSWELLGSETKFTRTIYSWLRIA